ncbi:MAG: 3-hydroxyacyl-ACP dehydratase FabZ [bacterium]
MNKEIFEAIPHRDPYLFVDKILTLHENIISAVKELTGKEDFFKGHYPGRPIMPGALACEAIFQTGAILLSQKNKEITGVPVVTRVNNVRFKKMITPPTLITMEAEIIHTIANVYFFKGKVTAGEKVCVSCEFACTIA